VLVCSSDFAISIAHAVEGASPYDALVATPFRVPNSAISLLVRNAKPPAAHEEMKLLQLLDASPAVGVPAADLSLHATGQRLFSHRKKKMKYF
jgi:hypothetical protein